MRSIGNQRGQSLLEFALLAPFVLFFLLALVDFGIAIDRRIVLDHAVREGARYAAVAGPGVTPASSTDVGNNTSAQAQGIVPPTDVSVTYENCNPNGELGDNVKIDVDYDYHFVSGIDGILGIDPTIPMKASATARVERGLSGSVNTVACPTPSP